MSESAIVTHARSVDNDTQTWQNNDPLSYEGINQARTLGKQFEDTHFTAIYTSDLKRAFSTAEVLYKHQKGPKPSFDSSELLRELNVGRAAGHRMVSEPISGLTWEQHAERGIYLAWYGDDDRFPEGESIKDLAVRARTALDKLVFPHVWQAAKEGKTGVHVAIVGHGLCISELISELLNWDGKKLRRPGSQYSDLPNVGWTRVVVDIEGAQEGQPMDVEKDLPVLTMRLTHRQRKDPYY